MRKCSRARAAAGVVQSVSRENNRKHEKHHPYAHHENDGSIENETTRVGHNRDGMLHQRERDEGMVYNKE